MKDQKDLPNFKTWSLDTLAQFAQECYLALIQEKDANEQLRLDLKDAMKLARTINLKDNEL
tara:strand:+ start:178 stop:360 length:183 start_codon:yes stop_codon:yes gene_type:complete